MSGIKPQIGIVTGFQEPLNTQAKTKLQNYIQAVEKSGAIPFLITPFENPDYESILSKVDGILLTGGGDIPSYFWGEKDLKPASPSDDPTTYHITKGKSDVVGQAQRASDRWWDENRAKFEIPLIQKVQEKDIPVLGICLGMQAINVAMGGSLYLDLTDPISSGLHCRKKDGSSSYHKVNIAPDSRLSKIFPSEIQVNSRHHQAIKNIASGFKVCARAEDDVIEAIENPKVKWMLGVQWHPEDLFEKQQKLFESFVQACL